MAFVHNMAVTISTTYILKVIVFVVKSSWSFRFFGSPLKSPLCLQQDLQQVLFPFPAVTKQNAVMVLSQDVTQIIYPLKGCYPKGTKVCVLLLQRAELDLMALTHRIVGFG